MHSKTHDFIESAKIWEKSTPCFVYSSQKVGERIERLKLLLNTSIILSYKASNQPKLIDKIVSNNNNTIDGIEVASLGELLSLEGIHIANFYINTPALNKNLIIEGIKRGADFIVDCPEQVDSIAQIVSALGCNHPRIMLRLSNRLIRQICPDIKPLREDHFGMDIPLIKDAVERAKKYDIKIFGLHLFAGSNMFSRMGHDLIETMSYMVKYVEKLCAYKLKNLNLGGGLEQDWELQEHDFALYRKHLNEKLSDYQLMHEFGRAIFSDCGIFAVKVLQTKSFVGCEYAVCDGGMAQAFLLARTENLLSSALTATVFCKDVHRCDAFNTNTKIKVVGSSCSRDDLIGQVNGSVKSGDILIFENCGAYVQSYSVNNFLKLGGAESYVL